jgi:glycerophosphoryl diester phosphodiesterase
MIIGHRGLRLEYPDNSREGIRAAATVCDMVEVDVRRTRDGVAVLAHDPLVGDTAIIDLDWAALAEVDLDGGHHPARLDHVLETTGRIPFNLEMKNSPEDPDFDPTFAFAREVASLASERDVVTSFHWPTVDAVHDAYPHLSTGLLVDLGGSLDEGVAWADRSGHEIIAPHWWLLGDQPASLIGELTGNGLQVFVWTVNDEEVARRLAAGDAAAIITDDPIRIRAALHVEETQ